jgi:hypothetical protein
MDTMWMMGLKTEFYEAVGVVAAQNFTMNTVCSFVPSVLSDVTQRTT